MVSDARPASSDDPPSARRPSTLGPSRGPGFGADPVGDPGPGVSPPYDVLDADTVRDLEAANRRNIVRLILSRRFERPYLAVRERLHKWRGKPFLRAPDQPSLYLYQHSADATPVPGLLGPLGPPRGGQRGLLPPQD